MGCKPDRVVQYNREYKIGPKDNLRGFGPYVSRHVEYFEETENYFTNKTLISKLLKTFESNPERESIGYKKLNATGNRESNFTFLKNKDLKQMASNLAKQLSRLNCLGEFFSKEISPLLGIFSNNCVEWIVTDLACQLAGITSVAVFPQFDDETLEHICNETELKLLCLSPDKIQTFIKMRKRKQLKYVSTVIVFDLTFSKVNKDVIEDMEKEGVEVCLFCDKSIEQPGLENLVLKVPRSDSVMTICYKTQEDAPPKGVMLTQRNFVASVSHITDCGVFIDSETVLSYLSFSHLPERTIVYVILLSLGKIGLTDAEEVNDIQRDLESLRPTVLTAVSGVLKDVRDAILDEYSKIDHGCSKSLIEKAIATKRDNYKRYGTITDSFYDSFLFDKVRLKFGNKLKCVFVYSNSADSELLEDIKIFLSVPIIGCYELTEAAGIVAMSHISDVTGGDTCGGCISTVKFKLADVLSLVDVHSAFPRWLEVAAIGEICIKGPVVFKSYYNNEKETKFKLDKEGWFHTGNLACVLPGLNSLKILDRIDHLFKLSTGQWVSPAFLESIYAKSRFVNQLCVYGDSKDFLIGLVVPNQLYLRNFLKLIGKITTSDTDQNDLLQYYNLPEIHQEIVNDFKIIADSKELRSFERIDRFILLQEPFSIKNGCLTPTRDINRKHIWKRFQGEIGHAYKEVNK